MSEKHGATGGWVDPAWVHPKCRILPLIHAHPMVELDDGSLLTVQDNATLASADDGTTWSAPRPIYQGPGPGTPTGGLLMKTRVGTLILAYTDMDTYKREWDRERHAYTPDSRREIWSIRSTDGGRTWRDRHRIFEGYGAAFINIMQARSGHVVLPLQGLLVERSRHSMCAYVTQDEGLTWRRSSVIDLGGLGNHDGAFEATVEELVDGRLLMLIRTNLDRFWEAFSEDHGLSWRTIRPGAIEASSAPGYLLRLASGRLVLVWNRLYPEGRTSFPRREPDGHAFSVPACWHREELSIAFSQDDAKSWSRPVVIAREQGGGIAYPYVMERRPGELWILSRHPQSPRLRVSLREEDFLGKPEGS